MDGLVVFLCAITLAYSQFLHFPGDGHDHKDGHGSMNGHFQSRNDEEHFPGDGHHHGAGHDKAEGHFHGDGHEHVDDERHFPGDGHKHVDARSYLTKFGYMNPFSFGERTVNDSIKIFQKTFGLKDTGVLDKKTVDLMFTPRCGMQDHKHGYSDRPWSITDLTYSFDNYTPDMPKETVEKVIAQALNYWAAVTPLRFTKTDKDGDILISFGTRSHGDSRGHCRFDFDGKDGVLAHAFFPENGRIHFDDNEYFTAHSPRGINFLWVATHELGHILGLEHDTQHQSAVMFPYYRRYHPDFNLHPNDVKRVRALYGTEKGERRRPASGGNHGGCHANCRDVARNCNMFKVYCKGHGRSWTKFLMRKCKKTCGHCC